MNDKGNTLILTGNVTILADKLVVSRAEKVVIEKDSNEVWVYGSSEFSFSGKLVTLTKPEGETTKLIYKAGEDTAYLN